MDQIYTGWKRPTIGWKLECEENLETSRAAAIGLIEEIETLSVDYTGNLTSATLVIVCATSMLLNELILAALMLKINKEDKKGCNGVPGFFCAFTGIATFFVSIIHLIRYSKATVALKPVYDNLQ